MKKRNRILSVLLCAAMVAGLAGCGSKNDSEDSGEKDGKIKPVSYTHLDVYKRQGIV